MAADAPKSMVAWARAHPRLVALLLGAVSACGFQPLALWPLALLAVAGLLALLSATQDWRRAVWLGWLFGLAHFTVGNNWIATAFTYQAEMPAALGWLAVPLLSLYLAVYPALAAGAARRLAGGGARWAFVFAFAACWIVSEWLRGWVFTGYPWNPLGAVLLGGYDAPGLARILPWTGTYALSGVAILVAGAGWLALARRRYVGLVAGTILLGAAMLVPAGQGKEGRLPFTIVQPNLPQQDIDDAQRYLARFPTIAELSRPGASRGKRLVMWPESGTPWYLLDTYADYDGRSSLAERRQIARIIGPDSLLMTGVVDLTLTGGEITGAGNAVAAIDGKGAIRDLYDKAHLVPYGEYLPLRWLLEPLGARRLVAGSLDFEPGPGPRTADLGPWGKAGFQICYEIVFSGEVVDPSLRPDYIFNPSNDGWFGSWGPPQHLAQARLRAIEEGLPVLRATTTGISAVIDANGMVRQHLGWHEAGRLDGLVPPAEPPTWFARLGNLLGLGWAVIMLVAALVATRRSGG